MIRDLNTLKAKLFRRFSRYQLLNVSNISQKKHFGNNCLYKLLKKCQQLASEVIKMKRKILIFSFALALSAVVICVSYSEKVHSDLEQSIVRLHVIANSDSDSDQALKLSVRDRILREGGALFEGCSSKEEAERIMRDNIKKLTAAAEDEIKRNGYSYPVIIKMGEFDFPMKQYEKYTFPAGKYDAVRVEIGDGNGKNWWCVMFPPLCFVDAAVSGEPLSVEAFKSNLTAEELDVITSDPGVDIRFKIVDFVQSSIYTVKTALKI